MTSLKPTPQTFYQDKLQKVEAVQEALGELLDLEMHADCPDEEEISSWQEMLTQVDEYYSCLYEMADVEMTMNLEVSK
jgi:hypothetical protein